VRVRRKEKKKKRVEHYSHPPGLVLLELLRVGAQSLMVEVSLLLKKDCTAKTATVSSTKTNHAFPPTSTTLFLTPFLRSR